MPAPLFPSIGEERAEYAFEYAWCKATNSKHEQPRLAGYLDCSAVASSGHESGSREGESLQIYGSTLNAVKSIVEGGRMHHCSSYAGYVESRTGQQVEICLAFRPDGHYGSYFGPWGNSDDELLASLYVDGSSTPAEEVYIPKETSGNPIKLGYFFNRHGRVRHLIWQGLEAKEHGSQSVLRGNRLKPAIDQLASLRVVVSRCIPEGKNGSSRLAAVDINPNEDGKAVEEASAYIGTHFSHFCALSDLHAVGNVLRTACSKRGRDVRDMIPLVEFVFYYKSKSVLEKLDLKPTEVCIAKETGSGTGIRPQGKRPEPCCVEAEPTPALAALAAHPPKRVKTEIAEPLFVDEWAALRRSAATPPHGLQEGHASVEACGLGVTGLGSIDQPYTIDDDDDEDEQVQAVSASSRRNTSTSMQDSRKSSTIALRTSLPSMTSLESESSSQARARGRVKVEDRSEDFPVGCAELRPYIAHASASSILLTEPTPNTSITNIQAPTSIRTSATSSAAAVRRDASGILDRLFRHTPVPDGSLALLREMGLTSTVEDFIEDQDELGGKFRHFMAAEGFARLRSNGWSSLNICRLFDSLHMELPNFDSRDGK